MHLQFFPGLETKKFARNPQEIPVKNTFFQLRNILAVATLSSLTLVFATSSHAATVQLTPSDNIQTIVKASPAGTAFVLAAGMYRGQNIQPKNGDTFTGQGDVRLSGATVLTFKEESGRWVSTATPDNTVRGTCQGAHPLCAYSQDLFFGGALQTPVASLNDLKSGTWYFDRSAGKVYIPVNPGSAVVEISMQKNAFSGSATNVTISNMMVEKFASYAQFGAIGGPVSGAGWIVNNVEVRYNHGTGVKLGSGSQLTNSFVHDNGELGVSLEGTNSKVLKTEISWNNYAGYALGWEAGGAKFSNTTNLLMQSNYVHDNFGPGLWLDTDNVSATYDSNTITHNQSSGIQHELSFSAIIKNNTLSGNGYVPGTWLWNGQISIQNSSNVQVYGNTIEVPAVGANGIAIINQNRGSGPMGPWIAANNTVHDNTITYLSTAGGSGLVNDTGSHPVQGNSFSSNHYIMKGGNSSTEHWWWFGPMTFTKFQTAGQDAKGTTAMSTN
jgi:hypothetical protein